ncbi:hypothetical protein MTO96_037958 [Rhipicephalus appendiculatus]
MQLSPGNVKVKDISRIGFEHPSAVFDGVSPADISVFGLVSEYDVLVAKKTCVTLAFVPFVNGKLQCMIWGIRADYHIEENDCYNSSLPLCGEMTIAVEEARSDPCHSYDEIDEILTKKAQEEQGIII